MVTASDGAKTSKKHECEGSDAECNYLNEGEEDEMEIYGYQESVVFKALMWGCVLLTLGVLRLVFHWWPEWMLYMSHRQCSLAVADKVLVVDKYEKRFTSLFIKSVKTISTTNKGLEKGLDNAEPMKRLDPQELTRLKTKLPITKFEIHLFSSAIREVKDVRTIHIKKLCYIWDDEKKSFLRLVGLDQGVTKNKLHDYHGYDYQEQYKR